MTIGTYDDFFRALGQNESGNNYSFVSSLGYLGRFQFGEEAMQAVGFYNGDPTSAIDFVGSWTAKANSYGVWDKAGFLNSPSAQDAATRDWFSKVNDDMSALGLKSYIGQWIGGGAVTESGLIAGGHLVGVWALKTFLESGGRIDTVDGYNTPVSEYVRRFGGYETPFSVGGGGQPPAPAPAPAPAPGGNQVLTSAYPGASLLGGAGADTLNASQGSDQLTGGGGADTFAFRAMPWSAGRITDFQAGTDRLDLSGLYANGYRGADPVADRYVSFVADGQGGTKVMLDVDGPGGGSTLSYHVVTLQGVAPGGLNAATVLGGGNAQPAPPPGGGGGGGQVLTSAYPGATLIGGGGDDTLNASQGSDQLTGGAGGDTFAFKAMAWSAGRITDFQVGSDRLDLTALYTNGYRGADPVGDGYVRFVADGAGGTKVMLDVDGPAGGSAISYQVVTLQGVSPNGLSAGQVLGGGAPAPAPTGGGQVLISPYPGASLAGGAGADTLQASRGADQLTGGAGKDHFVFGDLPWSAGRITDFQPGADALDLRALFAQAGYHGGDPRADGYLRLEDNGMGGTKVLFDADGWGPGHPWPTTITTLDGVKPWALGGSDFLFN